MVSRPKNWGRGLYLGVFGVSTDWCCSNLTGFGSHFEIRDSLHSVWQCGFVTECAGMQGWWRGGIWISFAVRSCNLLASRSREFIESTGGSLLIGGRRGRVTAFREEETFRPAG